MQDFMFATLLFLVYFCFACYLLHNPKAEATTSNPVPVVASTNPTVTLQVKQDDPQTRGHSDAERNVSRIERPVPLSQGSESPSESPDSVALFQEEFQSPYEMSPRLPISASPRLLRETVAPEPTVIEVAATPQESSRDEELKANIWEPATALVEVPIASKEPEQVPLEESARVEDAPESQIEPTLEQLLEGIDLNKLQLRPARKIASRLNIAQKVGGKDQPLGFLRAQIKTRLNEQPQEVAPVIEEILRAS
jgi:hypothetical protein